VWKAVEKSDSQQRDGDAMTGTVTVAVKIM
jgi:hypothetical protein